MRVVRYFLGLSLASVALGCSSSSTDTTTITRPELVAVSPDDFLATLSCGSGHDQVQSYVATLFNVSTPDGGVTEPGFQLPSSPPTSCLFQVTFSDVITSQRYLAHVDLYYRAPQELAPLAPGSRVLVDTSGMRVAPDLEADCGDYPATLSDGGGSGGSSGATAVSPAGSSRAGESGASGESGADADAGAAGSAQPTDDTGKDRRGLLTFDAETRTAHDCTIPHAPMGN